ncbi:MAG: proteasome subunit alpha, partial [Methanospirillum sp.]|nr:proteasome subunit alpha [Methanospirillum sp.]
TLDEAIVLGLKALHEATEGKFDVNTVEIGVITREEEVFRKMSREEVASYIEQQP